MGIDAHRFFCAESVPGLGAPLSVRVCECFLREPADTLAVPEFLGEIHLFLVSIRISGSTFEKCVDAGKCPIQQRNQIVFEIDFQFYVLIVLTAARFVGLPDLISRGVAFEISPSVKTIMCNFHSIQLVCFTLLDGIISIFVD